MYYSKRLYLLFNFLIIMLFSANCVAQSTAEHLGAMLQNINSMQADFVQVASGNHAMAEQSSGHMWLVRPGRFRWQINKPSSQLIVTMGNYLWIYDKELQQATRRKFDYRQAGSPASLLSGSVAQLKKDFVITAIDPEQFMLKPKGNNNMTQRITITFKNKQIESLSIVDNLGQHSTIIFSKVKLNQSISSKLFDFHPPAGVDVVTD